MDNKKLQYAGLLALTFFVLSSPQVYKLTNSVTSSFGMPTSNSAGCPNGTGLVVHGLVVGAILYALLAQNYIIAASRAVV